MAGDLAATLARALGDGVSDAPALRAQHAIGSATPTVVATPTDREAMQTCIAAVDAAGGSLVALGCGAHRGLGHTPRRYDVALVSRALADVLDYAPSDMTITAEAGLTVTALQEILARQGQWLPLEPPCPDATTLGGLVAADLGGRVRDFVIGIGAIMADGRAVRGGGKVVKNVAGYDLMKLLTGSLGTLAVVTEVTLKVRPRPAVRRLRIFDVPDVSRGLELADAIGSEAPDGMRTTLVVDGGRGRLVTRLAGVEADVAAMSAWLDARTAPATAALDTSEDDPEAQVVVEPLRDFARAAPGDVVAAIASLPGDAAVLADAVGADATTLTLDVAAGRTLVASATAEPARVVDRWAATASAHGAHLTLERWPLALENDVQVWRPLPAALPLMHRMKDELDPRATLAPGRFVGRI